MVWFTIDPYKGWHKDFARFDLALSQYHLKIVNWADRDQEIIIEVLAISNKEVTLVTDLAKQHFGKAYSGML